MAPPRINSPIQKKDDKKPIDRPTRHNSQPNYRPACLDEPMRYDAYGCPLIGWDGQK